MNNFLVRVHTDDDQIRDELHNQFAQNIVSGDSPTEAPHDSQQWEEAPRYILTEHYVDTYLTPLLIKNDEGDPYHCVVCELDVRRGESAPEGGTTVNVLATSNDVTTANCARTDQRTLLLHLCASHIYFEHMEEEEFREKTNQQGKRFREYKIKNRNVLLLDGSCSYTDKGGSYERTTDVKGLYNYISKNKHDLENALNRLEGSFFLLYIQYSNEHANIYFLNDSWGMKSVIFFYEQSSVLLTSSYGLFINYDFNFTKRDGDNYVFNNFSVQKELNLVHHDGVFRTENNILPNGNGSSTRWCKERQQGDLKPQSIINEKVGAQISPYYMYKFNIFEKNKVMLNRIIKKNSIYTKYTEWTGDDLSIEENFNRMCNFVESNYFLYSGYADEWALLKSTIQESMKKYMHGDGDQRRDAQTVLNNSFVHLYMKLLRGVIERKMNEVFSNSDDQSKVGMKNHLNGTGENEKKKETEKFVQNIPFTIKCDTVGGEGKSVGILFSGGIDSTLLTLTTIKAYFTQFTNGYIELINVSFDDNAVDRYTSIMSYEQIIKLYPQYDIRLVFVDVSPKDLLKYERIIFSLMSPSNTTMDFNISAAFFFSNLGKGVLFPRPFLHSPEWAYIKGRASRVLNVACQRGEEASGADSTGIEATEGKSKCRVCEFVMRRKCVHRCCSACCRKLRYVHRRKFSKGESSQESCNGETTRSGDIYQVERDENSGERSRKTLYLIVKKKRVLINFELFPECPAHKERVYDYERIDSLFKDFNTELAKRELNEEEQQNGNSPAPTETFKDTCHTNFIDQFVAKHAENDPQKFEQIKNLFYVKAKKKGNNDISMDHQRKEKLFIEESPQKEEETLNYLKKDLYMNCGGSHCIAEEEGAPYQCNHQLLIIGSGADELFGGYYRQNNAHVAKRGTKHSTNLKKNEMIKDVRRIWNRNLYRDDRILSFTSFSNKVLFYPYLDMNLVNFLLMISFYMIEAPLGGSVHMQGLSCFTTNVIKGEGHSNVGCLSDNLEECCHLYELIRTHKLSKWVLRMAIFFSHCKELMLFKKKAIQFGSKSKNVQMYMREWLSREDATLTVGEVLTGERHPSSKRPLPSDKKKGTDRYTLLS
ncbi:hypothetical protein AK88_00389 [Plasmodium fragile]|uniref:Asparagine synthase n=1 Tax=Plasmodium fragile TaxID=5857 RepID=A0A0D9QSJ6_PLAFR|nr:uncharacterized protein AK88_00389 [Plasmodium fragile]KJP89933.1 hypothetical protein AK88_00389 [Plasmodium fragile]